MKLANLEFNGQKFKRIYATTVDEMAVCCNKLLQSPSRECGLDIETAKKKGWETFEPVKRGSRTIGPAPGLCPLLSEIRLIQIYDPQSKIVFVFDCLKIGKANWKSSAALRSVLYDKEFFAHNAVFEIKHFTYNGFPDMNVNCSMLMAIMVDQAEHSPFEPDDDTDDEPEDGLAKYKKTGYSLDAVIGRLYKVRISKHFQTSDWNAPTLKPGQLNYAALDAVLTYAIGADMVKKIGTYKMVRPYRVIKEMQHVVADMEINGVAIDSEAHKDLIKLWEEKHAEYSEQCRQRFRSINLRSSKQLNEWAKKKYPEVFWKNFWPRTAASTDEKILLSFGKDNLAEVIDTIERKYKKESKALRSLLEFKKVDKLLSTYGETLARIVHPITGRIHASFIIGETRTGRLSSREPNLQNLPRDKAVRRLFVAPASKHLLVADYSQIEIRAQAALSGDQVMTNAFKKGIDLHSYILKMAFGWKMKDITKEQRQKGKAINFGFAFGMGGKKYERYALTSYGVKVKQGEGQHVFDVYHNLYKGYSRWCVDERAKCERTGFVRTPLGKMRRLLPDEQYTRAINTQVQGGAAEAIMVALIKFRKAKVPGAKIVSTIHDEIIIECASECPVTKQKLEECMTAGFLEVFPSAPTFKLIEAKYGQNWAEAK